MRTPSGNAAIAFRFMRDIRFILFAVPAVCLALAGCATTKMGRLMPHIEDMSLAKHYFGEPTSITALASGETRSEWLLDRVEQVPGQYVEETIFVGHDRDGFRVYRTRYVFVPAHPARRYCRLQIRSDQHGRVLASSWEGGDCEDMMVVPPTY